MLSIGSEYSVFIFSYKSTISHKESRDLDHRIVQFPRILICSDSVHSRQKIKLYPDVNLTTVEQLYGRNIDVLDQNIWEYRRSLPFMFKLAKATAEKDFKRLNKLNIKTFMKKTRPSYFVFYCQLQFIDCRNASSVINSTLSY